MYPTLRIREAINAWKGMKGPGVLAMTHLHFSRRNNLASRSVEMGNPTSAETRPSLAWESYRLIRTK
jgi:hypothetical protein